MSMPPLPPGRSGSGSSGSGHGPFGERAFHGALIGCGALVVIGPVLMLVGSGAVAAVGLSFLVLGALGLATGGVGLLAERHLLRRRRPAPRDTYRHNGRGPHPVDPSRFLRGFRKRS